MNNKLDDWEINQFCENIKNELRDYKEEIQALNLENQYLTDGNNAYQEQIEELQRELRELKLHQ